MDIFCSYLVLVLSSRSLAGDELPNVRAQALRTRKSDRLLEQFRDPFLSPPLPMRSR
jgi:hypothetical protein